MRKIALIFFFNLDNLVRKIFFIVSYLELWLPFSGELYHLCNFGKEHYGTYFGEILSKLERWFRRRCQLKTFLIYSSGGPFSQKNKVFVQFRSRV